MHSSDGSNDSQPPKETPVAIVGLGFDGGPIDWMSVENGIGNAFDSFGRLVTQYSFPWPDDAPEVLHHLLRFSARLPARRGKLVVGKSHFDTRDDQVAFLRP